MTENQYCSLISKTSAPSIVGTAGYKPCQIFVEFKQPWTSNFVQSPGFPSGIDILLKNLMRQYKVPITLNAMCRDIEDDKEDSNLFILYYKPGTKLAYSFLVYNVAIGKLEPFLSQLLPDLLGKGIENQQHAQRKRRAIMVCCHGQRDRCCGKFGQDLHEHISQFTMNKKLPIDVWKTSHIGGHKYAPTLIDLPSMRVWGHLSHAEAESLLLKAQFNPDLMKRYRGFCGLFTSYEQFAESEAFKKFGWNWLSRDDYKVSSDWQKDTEPANGQVIFSSENTKESIFRCKVSQKGTFESQASCFKPEKKCIPIYSTI